MKKILFVNPSIRDTIFGKMKMLALPPMGLGVLASRTPDTCEVSIVDENVDAIDFDAGADLVAVTATTGQAPRAYEIMREFRKRGVPSVMGGIHASVMAGEAARYADAVAVGEGDELRAQILDDFGNGKMKKIYRAETLPDITHIPKVNRKLFSKKYMIHSIQTSRGCPCNCSFCSVTKFNGARYRYRNIGEVIEEMGEIEGKRLFIADDSIVGLGKACVEHAKELFREMKGLGKSWGSQVCITIAEHDDLLKMAADCGANTFYIGFESIETESLKFMDKNVNMRPMIKNFRDSIKRIHDHGIGVIGGFILGSDGDTVDVFKKTTEFVLETGVDGCQFTIMTPFPGTRLYEQMKKEGRLLYTDYPNDWVKYDAYHAVIRPRNMTVDELVEGWRSVYDATCSLGKSLRRSARTLVDTGSLTNASINLFWNYYNYKAIRDYEYRPAESVVPTGEGATAVPSHACADTPPA